MAIKLKNKQASFLAILCLLIVCLNSLLCFNAAYSFFKPYTNSVLFFDDLNSFQSNLINQQLNHPSLAKVRSLPVSPKAIHEFRYRQGTLAKRQAEIRDQYAELIHKAREGKNEHLVSFYQKERGKKLAKLHRNFASDVYIIAEVRAERVAAMTRYYKRLSHEKNNFQSQATNFKYYFINKATGNVVTNLSSAQLSGQTKDKVAKLYSHQFKRLNSARYEESENHVVSTVLKQTAKNYSGTISIEKGDYHGVFASHYRHFMIMRWTLVGIALLTFGIILFAIYLIRKFKIRRLDGMVRLHRFLERLPLDFYCLLLGMQSLAALISFRYMVNISATETIRATLFFYVLVLGCSIIYLYQLQWFTALLRDKERIQGRWRQSLLYQFRRVIRDAIALSPAGWRVFVLIALFFLLGMLAPLLTLFLSDMFDLMSFFGTLLFLSVTALPLLYFVLRRVAYFNRLLLNTESASQGIRVPDLKQTGSELGRLATALNRIYHGAESSRNEQLKSERLKTELITNVSHDLRTPLTSIMTYSELLQTPALPADEQQAYIRIVSRKAKRLKQLIDDLFEASKIASGSMELNKTKTDLTQLITQALAEYDELIQKAPFDFRIVLPKHPTNVYADGQKIWRVLDNLIGNVLKYSLENTRVYIELREIDGEAVVSFKNVTKYELGGSVDDLFERFKRGDASRHTQGSGLGLAIAKSIIDLHGGSFTIDLDGDLFKIVFRLPLTCE